MGEWRNCTLGDFVTLQRGHDLPEHQRVDGDVPVIGSFGITGKHSTARTRGPGVTVGRSGASFGVVTYSPVDFWPLNTALYVINFHGNDERFAYYLLKNLDFSRFNSGSAQPSLNRNFIPPMPIHVPPIEEQRAIASVLGALDDKIDLNRRMNETLEAMARSLFKSWFVDYDPARAKAGGEQPWGMDAATAALFPDAFEDSDLGEIPQGWRAGSIADIAANRREGANPDELDRDTPYIGLEHMPRGSIALHEWETVEKVGSTKLVFSAGDILFGKLRPYFKKVGVAVVDGVCSSDILVVQPRLPEWFSLTVMQLSAQEFIDYTDSMSSGTKMPRVNWQDIARYKLPLPGEDIALAFDGLVRPSIERIRANIMESRTLVELRDTLLPKLLSGEVRVGTAEKMVEAAT